MMAAPPDWREEIAAALLDRTLPVPSAVQAHRNRFDIHRNTLYAGLVAILGAHFPVCRALVGGTFFDAMARVFVELHPPRSPVLLHYGDELPEFITGFAPAAATPYLADTASFEAARRRAYHAADLDAVSVESLAALPACRWDSARAKLHPAVEIVPSSWPILSLWQVHAEGSVARVEWRREDVLVTRPRYEVTARLLPPGGAVFLDALRRRCTFGQARALAARDPAFDLVPALATVFSSGALAAVEI